MKPAAISEVWSIQAKGTPAGQGFQRAEPAGGKGAIFGVEISDAG